MLVYLADHALYQFHFTLDHFTVSDLFCFASCVEGAKVTIYSVFILLGLGLRCLGTVNSHPSLFERQF